MSEIKGDLSVCRSLDVGRRVNQGLVEETITAPKQFDLYSHYWNRLDSAAPEDAILPDATTLPNGYSIVVEALTSTINVKTFDPTTPVLLKDIEPNRAYQFTLVDNGTDEGEWHVNFLEESDSIASPRYVETFDATTSWGAAVGGYYTITIPQSTHGRGANPQADLFELSGPDYIKVESDELKVLANGDIQFRVPETPDCRFAGKAVII